MLHGRELGLARLSRWVCAQQSDEAQFLMKMFRRPPTEVPLAFFLWGRPQIQLMLLKPIAASLNGPNTC